LTQDCRKYVYVGKYRVMGGSSQKAGVLTLGWARD